VSWLCSCGLRNADQNKHCADWKCKIPNPSTPSEFEFKRKEINRRTIICPKCWSECFRWACNCWKCNNTLVDGFCGGNKEASRLEFYRVANETIAHERMSEQNMTEREQLFARFFTEETKLVSEMSIEEIGRRIEDLELIAFEARAKVQAADKIKKERVAKLSESEREKLISSPELAVSDAISAIDKRKKRLSAADKLLDNLLKLGLSREEALQQMGAIKVTEEAQVIANNTDKLIATVNPLSANNGNIEEETCPTCGTIYPKSNKHECGKERFGERKTVVEKIIDRAVNEVLDVMKIEEKKDTSWNPFA
jgi:hypothetical protein